jgi:hypothetical protein
VRDELPDEPRPDEARRAEHQRRHAYASGTFVDCQATMRQAPPLFAYTAR